MSEFLDVAERLLEQHKRPMSCKEMIELAFRNNLFSDKITGKAPHQTLSSKLCTDIIRKGLASAFVRTEPGIFFLRRLASDSTTIYEAPRLKPKRIPEIVLAIPSEWLLANSRSQGVMREWESLYSTLMTAQPFKYIDRLTAEQDESYKQVITYIMVTKGDRVLAYKRGNFNRVEQYLRGSHCIGFGGHVTERDRNIFSYADFGIKHNAIRELIEELKLPQKDIYLLNDPNRLKMVGIINDDSSSTGRKHIGFVFKYDVSDDIEWDNPRRGETSITHLRWLDPSSDPYLFWNFEYWSQLCLRTFFAKATSSQPFYRIQKRSKLKPPHILCVIGGIGSGKSEATRILSTKYGYTEVNSGRTLARILNIAPVPETPRGRFQEIAWNFISADEGPEILAEALYEEAISSGSERVLIDGIRQKSTLDSLRRIAGPLKIGLLYVYAPPDLAYNLYSEREDQAIHIENYLMLRNSPVEQDVQDMISDSDAVLYNWIGKSMYHKAINQLMKEIGIERK